MEYSKEKCLLDVATLTSGMKKRGNSYEVEWISHGSARLLRPPRMDNQLLLSSLAAMFFVTNASLDMTEEESKYTGVHCITCSCCSSEMEWKLNEERSCYEEPSLSHFASYRHGTVIIFYVNVNGALLLVKAPIHLPNQKLFWFFVKSVDIATGSEDKASKQGRTVISSHEKDHLMCLDEEAI